MSDLPYPDMYVEPRDDSFVLVANKKARKVLNCRFSKPPPRWASIKGSDYLKSPEYRALLIGVGGESVIAGMLCAVHEAGLLAMFMCGKCRDLHIVDDEQARRLSFQPIEGAEGVTPGNNTVQ